MGGFLIITGLAQKEMNLDRASLNHNRLSLIIDLHWARSGDH